MGGFNLTNPDDIIAAMDRSPDADIFRPAILAVQMLRCEGIGTPAELAAAEKFRATVVRGAAEFLAVVQGREQPVPPSA